MMSMPLAGVTALYSLAEVQRLAISGMHSWKGATGVKAWYGNGSVGKAACHACKCDILRGFPRGFLQGAYEEA